MIIWLLCITPSFVFAADSSGFQMDTNMSETIPQKQNDSTLRFLQVLTNQQEEIQNLNLAIQQEKRKSIIERENLSHRISFMSFLLWGILAINGVLLFIVIIMGFRLKSFSKQIEAIQIEMDALQTETKSPSLDRNDTISPKINQKKQNRPEQFLDLSPSEEQELEGLLASDHDRTIFSDNGNGQEFFKQFQSEIDRERMQLNHSDKSDSEKSENDLLDELIEQHFSDELKGKG
jgi:hypothetical protein